MRTCVYIDGFNLYYRALRDTPHRWLDVAAMARAVLPAGHTVEKIKYYTAHVSGRTDPDAPRRQHAYLRALETIPEVEIFYGRFLATQKWAGLVQPPNFRPVTTTPAVPTPEVAYVWKTEEKGSDVNLGVHLVRDAFLKSYEAVAIVTNDTDLEEPIRIVAQELKLHTLLLTPTNKPSASLSRLAQRAAYQSLSRTLPPAPDNSRAERQADREARRLVSAWPYTNREINAPSATGSSISIHCLSGQDAE